MSYLKIIKLDEVDSTNAYAVGLAAKGALEVTVVCAGKQLKGRGRMGRSWDSPRGVGIYASFIFRPLNNMEDVYFLPLFFALGAARVLRGIVPVEIKYPNDLMVCGKKIAGVLVEAKSSAATVEYAVAGIGININAKKSDLPQCATSLIEATGREFSVEDLTAGLIKEELAVYGEFKKGGIAGLLEETKAYNLRIPERGNVKEGVCLI